MTNGIHIALKAETLTYVQGVPITNTMVMSWIVMLTLISIAFLARKRLTKIPGMFQSFLETAFGAALDYVETVFESRALALRFFPLLATLFFFILCGNWFGLLPGIGSITVEPSLHSSTEAPAHTSAPTAHASEEHSKAVALLHPLAVDLNVTLALAIVSFVVVEVTGVLFLGFWRYAGKFFSFRSPIAFLVGIIELLSELARLVSFSFRLFGNMFAGKTLILVAMFFVPYLLPVPLMAYEVLVGLIQASLFALLTLFFIKLAVSEAH